MDLGSLVARTSSMRLENESSNLFPTPPPMASKSVTVMHAEVIHLGRDGSIPSGVSILRFLIRPGISSDA